MLFNLAFSRQPINITIKKHLRAFRTTQECLFLFFFTFEHGSQFPHSKPSNRSVLTKSRLQKEQGHASKYEGQKVRNQKGP